MSFVICTLLVLQGLMRQAVVSAPAESKTKGNVATVLNKGVAEGLKESVANAEKENWPPGEGASTSSGDGSGSGEAKAGAGAGAMISKLQKVM